MTIARNLAEARELHPVMARALAPWAPPQSSVHGQALMDKRAWTARQHLKSLVPVCRCDAYPFPHREGGGKCDPFAEDEAYCYGCSGSGEGMHEGTNCRVCGGSGVVR